MMTEFVGTISPGLSILGASFVQGDRKSGTGSWVPEVVDQKQRTGSRGWVAADQKSQTGSRGLEVQGSNGFGTKCVADFFLSLFRLALVILCQDEKNPESVLF